MNKIDSQNFSEKTIKPAKNVLEGILPVTEKSANENEKKIYNLDRKRAFDLFSHFTANIIKEETTFIR